MKNINKSQRSCFLLILIFSAFLSTAYARQFPSETKDKKDIVIEGMVYCKSCNLKDINPISKATVNLKCINYSEFFNFNKLTTTDENGYFLVQIVDVKLIWDDPRIACNVELVSSPMESCSTPHVSVASLRSEGKEFRKGYHVARVYTAEPMSFRPADCTGG